MRSPYRGGCRRRRRSAASSRVGRARARSATDTLRHCCCAGAGVARGEGSGAGVGAGHVARPVRRGASGRLLDSRARRALPRSTAAAAAAADALSTPARARPPSAPLVIRKCASPDFILTIITVYYYVRRHTSTCSRRLYNL